jgi:hypothetical protein
MQRSKIPMLIATLALWAGQTFALTTQPAQPAPSQTLYSADEFYNLANSYARAGKPGLAVLSYERAALLAPGDPDINANLAYVRASARVSIKPQGWFARLVQEASPSPTWAAWLGVFGLALVGTGLLVIKVASRFLWIPRSAIALGVAQIALTVCNALLLWPRMHEAVVLIDQTAARAAPAPMADTEFVLREAESVRMTAEHEDFILIRTSSGLSGWVARANLGAVVPPVDGGR